MSRRELSNKTRKGRCVLRALIEAEGPALHWAELRYSTARGVKVPRWEESV